MSKPVWISKNSKKHSNIINFDNISGMFVEDELLSCASYVPDVHFPIILLQNINNFMSVSFSLQNRVIQKKSIIF